MPTAYYGIPGNVVYPASVNISSSTNASPIVMTTASAHGLQTGDLADIQGHIVNTKANGVRTVTRTGANSFSINGSTGNGAGGATGTVQPINYGAGYNIPSDGTDARNVASVNVPFQALGDRGAADLIAIPGWKVVNVTNVAVANTFNTPCYTGVGPQTGLSPMTNVNGALASYQFTGVASGDQVELTFDSSVFLTAAGAGNFNARVSLASGFQAYGAASPLVNTFGFKTFSGAGSSVTNYAPLFLRTLSTAPNPLPADGSIGFQIFVAFYFDTFGSTCEIDFRGDMLLTCRIYRPTGVPQ